MSTTLETVPTPTTSTRGGALRYYRLALLVLGLALAAMIAATVYLAVRSTPAATPSGPRATTCVRVLPPARTGRFQRAPHRNTRPVEWRRSWSRCISVGRLPPWITTLGRA